MHIRLVFENDANISSIHTSNIIKTCLSAPSIVDLEPILEMNYHLSLTRDDNQCPPWYIDSLIKRIGKCPIKKISFQALEILSSDKKYFLVLVCDDSSKELDNLFDLIDDLMEKFALKKYYYPRIPHVAIASFSCNDSNVPKIFQDNDNFLRGITFTVKRMEVRDSKGRLFIVN